MSKRRFALGFVLIFLLLAIVPILAQSPSPKPSSNGTSLKKETVKEPLDKDNVVHPQYKKYTNPLSIQAIPAKKIELHLYLRDVDLLLEDRSSETMITNQLSTIKERYSSYAAETNDLAESSITIDDLMARELTVQEIGKKIEEWRLTLYKRSQEISNILAKLEHEEKVWLSTGYAIECSKTDDIVLTEVDEAVENIQHYQKYLLAQQKQLFTLRNKVTDAKEQVLDLQAAYTEARHQRSVLKGKPDAKPLWNLGPYAWSKTSAGLTKGTHDELARLNHYVNHRYFRVAFWAIIFLVTWYCVGHIRRIVDHWIEEKPDLTLVSHVVDSPILVALLVTTMCARFGDITAPRIFQAVLGIAALIPSVLILRRLLASYLNKLISVLIMFYMFDSLRLVAEMAPLLERVLLLAETCFGCILISLYLKPDTFLSIPEEKREKILWRTTMIGRVAMILLSISMIANICGYTNLAMLIGGAVFKSCYCAMLIITALYVARAGVLLILHVSPLSRSQAVIRNLDTIYSKINIILQCCATVSWAWFFLTFIGAQDIIFNAIMQAANWQIRLGKVTITFGESILALLVVAGSIWFSRLLQFILFEDIVPRFQIQRSNAHVLSVLISYLLIAIGVVVGGAVMGFSFENFTVLIGALGVGIGFGLQTIVNNFFSGIIMLFEPRLRVGDNVEFSDYSGELINIGLRASVVKLTDGRELIVPNSDLMSSKIISASDNPDYPRRIDFDFLLREPTDSEKIHNSLLEILKENTDILQVPAPVFLMVGFEEEHPHYQLTAWSFKASSLSSIKSNLLFNMNQKFVENGIRCKCTIR